MVKYIAMNFRTVSLNILPWALFFLVCILWYNFSKPEATEEKSVINHNMVIEKIEAMGKLELVRFYIKDIVENTRELDWWPDQKVILMVSGEVVGCIDLTKIDSTKISIVTDKVFIKLPAPEVCYYKINHQESKVYNLESKLLYYDDAKLIDKAYAQAEKQLLNAATKMKILDQTKANAQSILKPMLQDIAGKPVVISFDE
jgi:hypothetical protein